MGGDGGQRKSHACSSSLKIKERKRHNGMTCSPGVYSLLPDPLIIFLFFLPKFNFTPDLNKEQMRPRRGLGKIAFS